MTGEDSTEATFCADHNDVMSGKRHGHTWRVEIFWAAEPFRDARILHAWLTNLLDQWDCKSLEEQGVKPATNFGLASTILRLGPQLTRVRVSRGGRVPCSSEAHA